MLTVDMILKRAMKGEIDLMGPAQAVANELMEFLISEMSQPNYLPLKRKPLSTSRKLFCL
jgi:hypothetical protein